MNAQWKNLLAKSIICVVTEILLTTVGLDTLADYGEFVFGQDFLTSNYMSSVITISLVQV